VALDVELVDRKELPVEEDELRVGGSSGLDPTGRDPEARSRLREARSTDVRSLVRMRARRPKCAERFDDQLGVGVDPERRIARRGVEIGSRHGVRETARARAKEARSERASSTDQWIA